MSESSDLIWNEDMDNVFGLKTKFNSENDFVKHVVEEFEEFTGDRCVVTGVRIKSCISTERGIEGETIIPLDETDVEINTYYFADVEEEEE